MKGVAQLVEEPAGTKAQSGSDQAKKGQNLAPIRSMVISEVNQTKQLFFILLYLTLSRIEYHFILA